jgi:hypothetical protein
LELGIAPYLWEKHYHQSPLQVTVVEWLPRFEFADGPQFSQQTKEQLEGSLAVEQNLRHNNCFHRNHSAGKLILFHLQTLHR